MESYDFVLVIDGDVENAATIDALYSTCSDATFGSVDGVSFGEFAREAAGFDDAVMSAVRDVEAVHGLRVTRLEPDDLVTLSEIAERLGRTRESVRLLAAGERGTGDFPPPISHLRSRSRLWRWSDVASWAGVVGNEERGRARFVALANAALQLRRRGEVAERERAAIAELLAS